MRRFARVGSEKVLDAVIKVIVRKGREKSTLFVAKFNGVLLDNSLLSAKTFLL